jgi:TatD DNase family protein
VNGFDTHCHLQEPRFDGRVPEVVARANAAGVTRMVCCGTREDDWDRVQDLARDHDAILPMLGLHPWFVAEAAPGWLRRLEGRVGQGRTGLGECGLDFTPGRPDRALQEAAFTAQARLAVALGLPLAIHCVRAWGRLTVILRSLDGPLAGAVVHGFSGSAEVAQELQSLGLHLGFSGAAGRPGARRAPRALAAVAEDRLLFETDAPWGPGLLGEPADLPQAVEVASRLRLAVPEHLAQVATANALQVFRRLLS